MSNFKSDQITLHKKNRGNTQHMSVNQDLFGNEK